MVDLLSQAHEVISYVKKLDETDRYGALSQLRDSNPDLYSVVVTRLGDQGVKAPMGRQ